MAHDNPRWGYTRIRGALFNLGHEIARNTIKRILLDNGFEPIRRNHQGLSNQLIEERQGTVDMDSAVVRHERLAGWRPYLSFFLSFFSFFSFAVSLALLVFALGFLSLLFAMLRGYTG
jgi:hypothetical protein